MTKVVINKRHGGFGLSEAGVRAYAERKGLKIYPESDGFITTYWTVPADQRPKELPGHWMDHSIEVRKAYNDAYKKAYLCDREIPRDDADLIAVVESLGEQANSRYSNLCVVEIPDDVLWQIEEYDGYEHVAEVHRTWG